MRVLAVNAGSSSLKLSVVDESDAVVASRESAGGDAGVEALRAFAGEAGAVDAVAHRVVHGGASIRAATVVDAEVRRQLDEAAALAPLHDPPALRLLDAARELVPGVPHVVCVDTAFHATVADSASTYAVPSRWRDLGVRRYGFHGLSYGWATRRAAFLLERSPGNLQMLLAHIGSGVSVCAVREGRSVDTSMGFTPLEGAVMATRSGSVDPGALLWLQQAHAVGAVEMTRVLEHESGLLGLCGTADMREVEARVAAGDAVAMAALDVYVHALCRNLGAVAAALDRVDVLVFTGGVGEHSALLRSRVCAGLGVLGVAPLEAVEAGAQEAPAATGGAAIDGDAIIVESRDEPSVVVIAAREDAEMARETRQLLGGGA